MNVRISIAVQDTDLNEFQVRHWIGPEIDDGFLGEPRGSKLVIVDIPNDIVQTHGAETVMQAIGSAMYKLQQLKPQGE
jgi:hypothetical protein